ncbi:zinc finger protein 577-like [Armigeres subalbatus]|uniref:zinc finger protein 577-like n=1 Tax=Armigeres subalbatus TaxID=124917 RepID=UPI002ED55F84
MGKKEGDAIIQAHMHFSCTICNDKCDSFVALKSHMVDKHDAKACVPCCGKNYHHKRDLLLHAIDMRDRQTFRCGRCYRKFETKERKERHMKGHENKDNRAYKCKKCGKTFAFRGPYKDHLNETHGKADILSVKAATRRSPPIGDCNGARIRGRGKPKNGTASSAEGRSRI